MEPTKHVLSSTTIRGILVMLAPKVCAAFGWKFDLAANQELLELAVEGLGALIAYYGRYRLGDLHHFAPDEPKFPSASAMLLFSLFIFHFSLTGCASAHRNDAARKGFDFHGIVSPAGTVAPRLVMSPGTGTNGPSYTVSYDSLGTPGTNALAKPFAFHAFTLKWQDSSKGGGTFLLSDPKASAIAHDRQHQSELGGSFNFSVGQVQSDVSTNGIAAAGTAVGNVVKKAIQGAK
ncbi:MAG: hypothetical protein EBS05_21195 [Proteobacteria bacterium]|nr:hypothetical protein [Pseudomonadota bacterium]